MAKRIRVKNTPPRGLSKAQRIAERADREGVSMRELIPMMYERIRSNDIINRRPSSTRKKLVKEGNRKFIGPRTPESEEQEYREAAYGPFNEGRWYKKSDARLDEKYAYEDNKAYERRIGPRRARLEPMLNRKVDRAFALLMAPPGADRSMARSELARVILAARKIKDPEARNKVLSLIKNKMSRTRGVKDPYGEGIPF